MSAPTTRRPEQSETAPNGGDPAPAAGKPGSVQSKRIAPHQLTGAQAVIRSLEELDVDVIFGIPGGAVLPVYDPLFDSQKLRHVLVRHEQGAGHAASGYAHATGKVGVCMATSGPGATNLVTPLADAYMDSIPVVAVTGQVGRALIGTDAFQEADISGITMPITKHNFLVRDGDDIARVMAEAFHIASSGRPGPVLVDIPKDVLQGQCTFSWPPQIDLPGYKPNTKPHNRQVREAAKLIAAARKPVLYVGGGVIRGDATERAAEPGRADRHPRRHHADGPRRVPGQPSAEHGHAGHARHGGRGGRAAAQRSADRAGHAVRRPGDGQAGLLRSGSQGHPRRHRPGRDRQEPQRRRADRR